MKLSLVHHSELNGEFHNFNEHLIKFKEVELKLTEIYTNAMM